LATTPQIVREFLVVATRPPRANGLGLSVEVAVANVEIYLERLALLAEDARVVSRLRTLVAAGRAQGVPIHDANIVASALVHGARRIVTGNIRHFERFADLIPVEALN
jgi:predicted nucleic acid-binding protein